MTKGMEIRLQLYKTFGNNSADVAYYKAITRSHRYDLEFMCVGMVFEVHMDFCKYCY